MEQLSLTALEKFAQLLSFLSNPLTALITIPLIGVFFIAATKKTNLKLVRIWALLFSGIVLGIACLLLIGLPESLTRLTLAIGSEEWLPFAHFLPFSAEAGLQFESTFPWLQIVVGEYASFGVNYSVALDGLSMPLVLMSAAVIFCAVIWALPRTERIRDFFALTLLMESGLLGVFVAQDYVLFYLLWELMLIPMYFLIAGWGKNREKASKAAIKFFIYTMAGSVFILIAFIAMKVLSGGVPTFSIQGILYSSLEGGLGSAPFGWRVLMFLGLLVGFAVKVPMFPFHTWLPDAHTEAPTEMSVILAAVMLKTGTYGFLRILYPTFPDVCYRLGPLIAFCGVAAIIYGAAITLVQTDIKRMVAYSSISHMGFIILGVSAMNVTATTGAVFHMVGHGIIITVLFFLCGVIERRYGTRDLRELGGMWQGARSYAIVLGIAAFAGMGLPGLAGFWGEFMVLKGTFYNNPNWMSVQVGPVDASRYLQILAALAVLGILAGAVYMINMLQRVLPSGDKTGSRQVWRGFKLNEGLVLVPLTAAIIILGLYPAPIIEACRGFAAGLQVTQLLF